MDALSDGASADAGDSSLGGDQNGGTSGRASNKTTAGGSRNTGGKTGATGGTFATSGGSSASGTAGTMSGGVSATQGGAGGRSSGHSSIGGTSTGGSSTGVAPLDLTGMDEVCGTSMADSYEAVDNVGVAHPPSCGNDGNRATRWTAADGLTTHYWQLDFGCTQSPETMVIYWEYPFATYYEYYGYTVAVSTDCTTFSSVIVTQNTGQQQWVNFPSGTSARCVRIYPTKLPVGGSWPAWPGFWEVSFYTHARNDCGPSCANKSGNCVGGAGGAGGAGGTTSSATGGVGGTSSCVTGGAGGTSSCATGGAGGTTSSGAAGGTGGTTSTGATGGTGGTTSSGAAGGTGGTTSSGATGGTGGTRITT